MMGNINLEKHYDDVYKNDSSNYYTTNSFEESLAILDIEKNYSGKKILEIGCGEGRLSAMLAMAGANSVLGVDYSEEAIAIAENHFNLPGLSYEKKNYKDLDSKYDYVIMQGVLEHLDEPFNELKDRKSVV